MKNVLIPTKLQAVAREILSAAGFAVVQDGDRDLSDLAKAHPETEALIVRSETVDESILGLLPKLRLVIRAGAGYNTIDVKAARRRNVDVMNTPGANANAVAEEALAMILAVYRHVVRGDNTTRQGLWEKKSLMGRELSGKTVGVVGLGNIGQRLVALLGGFKCRVLGYDPVLNAKRAEELGFELVSLDDLFSQADIVSLHVPQTRETAGMVGRELLDLMREGAMLVNCARSGVVDEAAVREVKQSKRLVFCTDVYPKDEPGEKPVAEIADLMLPHLGASTVEANTVAATRAAEQLIAYAERGVTRYVVNKGVPDELDEQYQELAYQIAMIAHSYWSSDQSVRRIECSFYGELHNYAKWFKAPIVAGIASNFDGASDPEEAAAWLERKGIGYEVREPADSKSYGSSSMTIDLLSGKEAIHQVSVRGTLTEGRIMVSRINDFDNLYFQPAGHSLIFVYRDRPGVLAKITGELGNMQINIDDIRSPLNSAATHAMAVLKTNREVAREAVEKIAREIDAEVGFALTI